MIVTQTSSLSGTVEVAGGSLQLGDGTNLGSLGLSAITVDSLASLVLDAPGTAASPTPFVNNIVGQGSVVVSSANPGTTGVVLLTGNNTYSGTLSIQGGLYIPASANAIGGWATLSVSNQGQFTFGTLTGITIPASVSAILSTTGFADPATGRATGALLFTGTTNTWAGGITVSGTAEIGAYNATSTTSGFIGTISGVITGDSLSNLVFGSGPAVAGNSETIVLTGPNTWAGGTTIQNFTSVNIGVSNTAGVLSPSTTGVLLGGTNANLNYDRTDTGTFTAPITGTGNLAVRRGGTLVLSGANSTYSGTTTVTAGSTLRAGALGVFSPSTSVILGAATAAGQATAFGTLDLQTFSQTIAGLTVSSDVASAVNTVLIGSPASLTINVAANNAAGLLVAANKGNNDVTNLTFTGGGSLAIVGADNTDTGIQIGDTAAADDDIITVDMRSLSAVSMTNLGTIRLGDKNSSSNDVSPAGGGATTLFLAPTSTLSATTLGIADIAGQNIDLPDTNTTNFIFSTINLGSARNVINVDNLFIGGNASAAANIRGNGMLQWLPAVTTGSLILGGQTPGTPVANFNMVNTASASNNQINAIVNLGSHSVTASIGSMTMSGRSAGGSGAPNGGTTGASSSFSWSGPGSISIASLTMDNRSGGTVGNETATVNLTGNTGTLASVMSIGSLIMGQSSVAGTVTATLNVGGNVTLNVSGNANLTIGSASLANTSGGANTAATALNIGTGASVVIGSGGLSYSGTATATLSLSGGTLDLGGNAIGSQANPITATFAAGTLQNVAEFNGGAVLTKSGSGTLTLLGANAYTGGTSIAAGILQVGAGAAAGTLGSGTVTDSAALVFNHNDVITVANAITGTGTLTQTGSGSLTLTGTDDYTGATTVSAGSLLINGSLTASTVSVAGGILGGSGTVSAVVNSAVVNPGVPGTPGALTVAGNLTLGPGSLVLDLTNSSTYDSVLANGSTDITGTTLSLVIGAATINMADTFTILDLPSTSPAVTGFFVGLPGPTSTFMVGTQTFSINYAGGPDHNDVVLTVTSVSAVAVSVTSVVRNGGIAYLNSTAYPAQHSMVENLVYSFSGAVNLSASNFTITGLAGSGTTIVPTLNVAHNGANTVWTVTFSGAGVNPTTNSIGDGEYQVVLGGVSGLTSNTYDFFRLMGDMNGDGLVNISDFSTLIGTFLRATNDPAYLGADDLNGDGQINISDINLLVGNFLHSVPQPLPN